MAENDFYIGPRKYEGVIVFYRLLSGLVGGLAGGLVILIGLILAGSLLTALADPTVTISPFAIFMAVSVLFMAGLVGNGLSVFLMSLSDQDKYQNPYRGLLQVAIINIVIFLISIGAYFIARSIDVTFMIIVALVQFITSALASTFVFSAVTVRPSEFVIEIYGGFISILLSLGLATLVYYVGQELALFFGLPIIIWFSIGFFGGLTEFFYYQLYRHTGVDVLETGETDYQEDEDQGFNETQK